MTSRGSAPLVIFTKYTLKTYLLTMPINPKPGLMSPEELRRQKTLRDAEIVKTFNFTQSIHETRKALGFIYSREVIRKAISRAGLYDRCKRENMIIDRAKQRVTKPKTTHQQISKQYRTELEMQKHVHLLLCDNSVAHESEVKVEGCGMRADFVGSNWAIETKIQCTSQGLLVGMAQCLVYRKHFKKRHTCILIPDDLEPGSFYASECLSHGIPIIKISQLIWWIRTIETDAQPG